jgi:hypothetical protein
VVSATDPYGSNLDFLDRSCYFFFQVAREKHRLRVFENRVLRKIFGPKSNEVTGGWRKLHNEKLRDLDYSSSIIRMIKSRRMRWAGHVARMRKRRMYVEYWRESQM